MSHFLTSGPADAMLATMGDALDLIDVGIVLLDRNMRVLFINRPFDAIWRVPWDPDAVASSLCELLSHVTGAYSSEGDDGLRERVERIVSEVPAKAHASAGIDLSDGRRLLCCCHAGANGARVLTCTDITRLKVQEDRQREAREAAERAGVELRFNKETLEDQASYLASLAEESDANARRAEDANRRLEREIAERRQLEAELQRLATTDALTGTLNRRQFLTLATQELVREREHGLGLAALMVDIDHFKMINDRHGHAVGDKALKHMVGCLRTVVRGTDLIGRLGGEEFAIILPAIADTAALQVADRLRLSVEASPLVHNGVCISMTVSIGLAMACDTDRTIEQVIAGADARLYRAKGTGRNRVCHDLPAVPA